MATPSGDILNRKIADGGELAKECAAIEEDIAALRMSYEQYFLGMERRPPTVEHNELKKRMQKLKGAFVRQTALKFRIQALQAKLTTYERLWSRTIQEIENGTYRRDLFKAKLHAQGKSKAKEKDEDKDEEVAPPEAAPLKAGGAPAPPQAAAPAKAAAKPAAPPPQARPAAQAAAAPGKGALSAALSDQKLKAVYDAYVTAKKRCQEDVSRLSYDQVAANLRKQVPELVKKAGAQGVEFKVIIKDGKAILRAVPK